MFHVKMPSPFCFHLIIRLLGDFPRTQWAAEATHWGAINEPPQNGNPDVVCNIACQGQLFCAATVPPTIRTLGFDPQLPINNNCLSLFINSSIHQQVLFFLGDRVLTNVKVNIYLGRPMLHSNTNLKSLTSPDSCFRGGPRWKRSQLPSRI